MEIFVTLRLYKVAGWNFQQALNISYSLRCRRKLWYHKYIAWYYLSIFDYINHSPQKVAIRTRNYVV